MSTHLLHLHPDHQRALEAIAAEEHCSPEMLVHDVMENYIRLIDLRSTWSDGLTSEEERRFTDRATTSLAHYRKTGLHVTHEEVLAWFKRLRQDPKAQPPACHT